MRKEQPIGIFDSGLGGISVLAELRRQLPRESFLYFGDSAYAPYGIKEKEQITKRCFSICDRFVKRQVKAIVVACNTATSACVHLLRERYPDILIIGMEPALKVAAERGTRQRIIVMATPLTLKEQKFDRLVERFRNEHTIYRQPCPRLVELVENDQLQDTALVEAQLWEYLYPYDLTQIDSIVLGCTHFVFYRPYFTKLLPPRIALIDGNRGTALHLADRLQKQGTLCETGTGSVRIENSSADPRLLRLSEKLLGGMGNESNSMGNLR